MAIHDCRTFANDVAELRPMSQWLRGVADAAGVDPDTSFAAELCLNEAAANIITHGFRDGASHAIRIDLEAGDGGLRLTMVDDGQAFNPLQVEAPASATSLDDASVGGLGIPLMRVYASDLRYRRDGDHNVLVLTFGHRPPQQAEAPA